jgi:plastocyanin
MTRPRAVLGLLLLLLFPPVACADDRAGGDATPDSEYPVAMTEYDFVSPVAPDFRAGDTVRFVIENVGVVPHEMQVLDAEASLLGRTGDVAAGDATELVVTFDDAGIYQLICDIDDHLSRGQRVLFEVTERDGTSVVGTPSSD